MTRLTTHNPIGRPDDLPGSIPDNQLESTFPKRQEMPDSEPIQAEMLPAEQPPADTQVQSKQLRVRTSLGQELCELIKPDLPKFYKQIRNQALGRKSKLILDSRARVTMQLQSQRLYLSMVKMANANIDVNQVDYHGGIDEMMIRLKGVSTEDLQALRNAAKSMEAKGD